MINNSLRVMLLSVFIFSNYVGFAKANSGVWVFPLVNNIEISEQAYGTNNFWDQINYLEFDSTTPNFFSALTDIGQTMMRYPGGWESEWYTWHYTNTPFDTPGWSKRPSVIGAKPWQIKSKLQATNQTGIFVLRTKDYIQFKDEQSKTKLVNEARGIVSSHKGVIKKWELGNEWYKMSDTWGCRNNRRYYYSQLARQMAQQIKAEDPSSEIYITADWKYSSYSTPQMFTCFPNGQNNSGAVIKSTEKSDFIYLKEQFGTDWNLIDGVSVHVYTGINPQVERDQVYPPKIEEVKNVLTTIKNDIGTDKKILITEWAASKDHNKSQNYPDGAKNLVAANYQIQLMQAMLNSGIDGAAYWPPARVTNGISLLNYGLSTPTPLGSAFKWMSNHIKGNIVPISISSNGVKAVSAKYIENSQEKLAIFLLGEANTNEVIDIRVVQSLNNIEFDELESASVMYSSSQDPNNDNLVEINEDITSNINISVLDDATELSLTINPGGVSRGQSYEIIKIILK